jgi:hypothetical protein
MAYSWELTPMSTEAQAKASALEAIEPGTPVSLTNLPSGRYRVALSDLTAGRIIGFEDVHHTGYAPRIGDRGPAKFH